MFRRIWNYFFGKWYLNRRLRARARTRLRHKDIDLDEAAKGLVGKVFPPKSDFEEHDDLVELLDSKHLEGLGREVDPLEGMTEISDDSVISGKANIPLRGEPSQFLKQEVAKETAKPDRIQREGDAQIHTASQPLSA